MEDQCSSSPLSFGYYYQEEGIEELKHSLLLTTLELETILFSAHEEISRKEEDLVTLKYLLTKTIKEKEEAEANFQMLILEKVIHQQQQLELKQQFQPPPPPLQLLPQPIEKLIVEKKLPENGRFLQAVVEAGPLLKNLVLAGPLPQWQQPPPQLSSFEIPPVAVLSPPPGLLQQDSCVSTNSNCFSKKRGHVHCEGFDFNSPNSKYQKVVHQSALTNGLF